MAQAQPEGFLAAPPSGSKNPVLVLHAWWGLNDSMRDLCTRLAGEGFTAFAPDLYHGKTAATIPEAKALSSALDDDQARAETAAAGRYLTELTGKTTGLAVMGFSLGAYLALDLSAAEPGLVHSVVVFYGTGPEDFSQSRASYQGHFAENDDFEPLAGVDALEKALKQAGRPVTFFRYPGAGHWFFEHDREQAYNPESAALAWGRTLAFLEEQAGQ